MLKIYLTRHGQDEDNANGVLNGQRNMPLTVLGVEQANDLALKIKASGIKFDKIYSSPLQRALKTASIINNVLAVDNLEQMPELMERDFGVLTGQPVNIITKWCAPNIIKTATVVYALEADGLEAFPALLERAHLVLNKIKKANKKGNVLLVTHGDIGKMIYTAYYNLDWKDVLRSFHFGNSDLLLLSDNNHPLDPHIFKAKQFND